MPLTPHDIYDYMQTFVQASDLSPSLQRKVMTRLFSQFVEESVGSYDGIHRSLVNFTEYHSRHLRQAFLSKDSDGSDADYLMSLIVSDFPTPRESLEAEEAAEAAKHTEGSGISATSLDDLRILLKSKVSQTHSSVLEKLLSGLEGVRLSRDSIDEYPIIFEGIEAKIGKYRDLFEDGKIDARRVMATFRTAPSALVSHGYDPDTALHIHALLCKGAPLSAIGNIAKVDRHILYFDLPSLPNSLRSSDYPVISAFAEERLRQANEKGYSPVQAGNYAGVKASTARGFFRKMGFDYFSPVQKEKIRQGVAQGLSQSQISSFAHINLSDVPYACRIMLLPFKPQKRGRCLDNFQGLSTGNKQALDNILNIAKSVSKKGLPLTSASLAASQRQNSHFISLSAASHLLERAHRLGFLDMAQEGRKYIYSVKIYEKQFPALLESYP